MISFGLDFNVPAIRNEMDAIGRQALPRVWEQVLNDTAFAVRDRVKQEIASSVDHPKNYTLKPMTVIKAKWRDGDRMFARVEMLPDQANYLFFPITGALRRPGDPGTAQNDILTYSAQPTAFGGTFNKVPSRRLVKKAKDEKAKRAARRTQRAVFSGPGPMSTNLLGSAVSRTGPGMFWGVIHSHHGLWQRPDAPGSQLKLLLAFQPQVQTPVTIHYDRALFAGYHQQMTEANFVRTLQAKKAWPLNGP